MEFCCEYSWSTDRVNNQWLCVSLSVCSYFFLMFVGEYYCCYKLGFTREYTIVPTYIHLIQ